MKIILVPFAIVCLCSLSRLKGAEPAPPIQQPPTNPITLDAVVAEILDRNPELKFYQAEISAAKGERRAATTWANPEISATIGQKQARSGGISDEGFAWSVSLQQPLEWPGRISLRKAIANRQIRLAELGVAQFKASLNARAHVLAYTLFAAEEKAAATREVSERFHQVREVLVQRDPAGLTPELELRIIEATELTFLRKVSETKLASESALLELNQLRGSPWTETLRIEPVKLKFVSIPEETALLTAAQTNNFDLQMRRVELEQQGFKVSLARKEGFPALSVGPYFSREKAGDREQQVGVGLSLPIPLWNRNKGNVAAAEARAQQAETTLFVAQRELDRKIIEAVRKYQSKIREMENWRPDSIEEFRKAASLADRHYRLGAVPIATYVELQKQYLEAVEALLDTKKEALEAAQEIERLTGLDLHAVESQAKQP